MTDAPRQGWSQSARWRRIASEHCKKMNADPSRPRCGAKRRSTGEPCRNVAMSNGRCYIHGGKTPKGDNWHEPAWPKPERPDAEAKLREKVRALAKRAKRRARRLAAMTDQERAEHEAWHASRRPGPAGARRRQKALKLQKLEAARILALPPVAGPSVADAPGSVGTVNRHHAARRPRQSEEKERPMARSNKSPAETPAAVEAGLADLIRTEGLRAAYGAALEVCQDKKAAPAARATAAGWIFRIAGFDAKKNDGSGKELYEMSADEIAAEHNRTQAELDRLMAMRDSAASAADGDGDSDGEDELSAFD